jgi:hypothetical protein
MGNNLNLVGATWFIATNDEFVRYSYIGGEQNPDDICKNINGYGNPCYSIQVLRSYVSRHIKLLIIRQITKRK